MKRSPHFYLALITLFGAVARLWFFWSDGLHVDEKFTLDLVQHDLVYVIHYAMTNDCNPPLFYIIDWFSVALFGANAFAERLPSVIFGILLIPSVYFLGKEIRGDTLGLLSALAVSTLGSMWYYSGFGRSYMLNCLLFTWFCIYFIRLSREKDGNSDNWIGLIVTVVWLAYSHLFTVVPVGILTLYLIIKRKGNAIRASILAFLLASPLFLLFNAILKDRAVSREIAAQSWNWYGATVPQIIIFAPLEFFSYSFVFWIPLIAYATWTYRKMQELVIIIVSWLASFGVLLLLADITPVFIRYTILAVPAAMAIGLLPVADFLDNPEVTKAQKWFVMGTFGTMYFAVIAFAFTSGLYLPKGVIVV